MRTVIRRSAGTRTAAIALVVATGLALAAGCGVPVDDQPREIDAPGAPYPPFGAGTPLAPGAGPVREPLCLVRDDRLVRVARPVPGWPTIETQLRDLLAGPQPAERDDGLTSALPGTMAVTGIRISRGRVDLEVENPPDGAGRSDQVLAYGQIVCTLTTRPDVTGVAFTQDGRPVGVPRADGSLTSDPLGAADYASLID
jgi:hypothetical protein